jgi:chromate transporter
MPMAHDVEHVTAPEHPMPRSPADLFWSFSAMALQGFGGVMAVAQNELVERRRWMTREEFIGDWAVAQVLPGPNMINLSLMMGDRCFGLRGALAAMAGMITFPAMLVLLLAVLYSGVGSMPEVQGALRGMGAVIVSLIAVNAVKLAGALKENAMGLLVSWMLAASAFVAVALLRLPLLWALMLLGGLGWGWAYRQLGVVRSRRSAS